MGGTTTAAGAPLPTATPSGTAISEDVSPGRYRVLVTSTLAFTLMFAVWLQFGILGLSIQKEFGLSDTAFYWLTALGAQRSDLACSGPGSWPTVGAAAW